MGLPCFQVGEGEAGQGMMQGRALNAESGGGIPARLWKRDRTKLGTSW